MPSPSIYQNIALVSPAKNAVFLRLITEDYDVSGTPYNGDLDFAAPVNDHKFDLVFDDIRLTYTLKTVPDANDAYQIKVYSNSAEFDTLVDKLKANKYLSDRYDIVGTYASNRVTFTANTDSSDLNMDIENNDVSISLNSTAAVEINPLESYKCFVDLFKQNDYSGSKEIDKFLATLDADPHREDPNGHLASNEHWLDYELQEILKSELLPHPPIYDSIDPFVAIKVLLTFWFKYYEFYGADPLPQLQYSSGAADNYFQVLLAGYKTNDFPNHSFLSSYIFPTVLTDKLWLTNQPSGKVVNYMSKEWLYLYLTTNGPALTGSRIQADIYYTDGTNSLNNNVGNTIDFTNDENKVVALATGIDQLSLDTITPAKTICEYRVRLVNGVGTKLCSDFKYFVDTRDYRSNEYLQFFNQLSGFDGVWCNGTYAEGAEFESSEIEKSTPAEYSSPFNPLANQASRTIAIHHFHTGWKTKDELLWLKELMNSDYVLFDLGDQWQEIRIEKKSISELYNSDTELYALSFTGRRLESNN